MHLQFVNTWWGGMGDVDNICHVLTNCYGV